MVDRDSRVGDHRAMSARAKTQPPRERSELAGCDEVAAAERPTDPSEASGPKADTRTADLTDVPRVRLRHSLEAGDPLLHRRVRGEQPAHAAAERVGDHHVA